ncbi:hypothetical protein TELCIR_02990, partial [Teladorsagia circumcincta]
MAAKAGTSRNVTAEAVEAALAVAVLIAQRYEAMIKATANELKDNLNLKIYAKNEAKTNLLPVQTRALCTMSKREAPLKFPIFYRQSFVLLESTVLRWEVWLDVYRTLKNRSAAQMDAVVNVCHHQELHLFKMKSNQFDQWTPTQNALTTCNARMWKSVVKTLADWCVLTQQKPRFVPIQCDLRQCWCVDVNYGTEIAGSAVIIAMKRGDMCR